MTDPIIVTAWLDPASQARFERERQAYFPPSRNLVPAHLTLFHAIPADALPDFEAAVDAACAAARPMPIRISGVRSLGKGVAYTLHAAELSALRRQLAALFHGVLGPQDRQAWQPHVTIQNKVSPAEARELRARLEAGFSPLEGWAVGLQLWRYESGPWRHLQDCSFRGPG